MQNGNKIEMIVCFPAVQRQDNRINAVVSSTSQLQRIRSESIVERVSWWIPARSTLVSLRSRSGGSGGGGTKAGAGGPAQAPCGGGFTRSRFHWLVSPLDGETHWALFPALVLKPDLILTSPR